MNDNNFSNLSAKDHINVQNFPDKVDRSVFLSTEIMSQKIPTLEVAVILIW